MYKRRFFVAGVVCVLALLLAAPLSAQAHHGGGRHGQTAPAGCQVCPVEGCTAAGRHTHSGVTYCGYAHESGFCDGSCRALCPVEGCTAAGRHTHNGVTYCGYAHESGFCDGSCQTAAAVVPAGNCHGGGHHRGHHG